MSVAVQSREDERACGLQARVSELEALVCAACGRGVEASRCRDVIDDAVRRARRKGAMLQHMDSSLLLATLEQAKSEIASLTDVAATNAEVMQEELLHHRERQEEQGAEDSEDVTAASCVSVPASSVAAPSTAAASSEAAMPGSPTGHQAEDSPSSGHGLASPAIEGLLSVGSRGSTGGGGSGTLAPRTPYGGGGGWLAPADVVAPLRDFASEVAAEAAVEIEEVRSFRHSMSMRVPRKDEAERVANYDFDAAMSPRASYHVRDVPFHRAAEPELSYFGRAQLDNALDEAVVAAGPGEQQEDEEGTDDEAGPPLLVYSRTHDAAAAGRESPERYLLAVDTVEEGEEEGPEGDEGEGGTAGAAGAARAAGAAQVGAALARRPFGPRSYSPRGGRLSTDSALSPWVGAQRREVERQREMERQRSHSAGEVHCWSAMPPGFYPGAAVEGSAFCGAAAVDRDMVDPSWPTGVGIVDLESYNSAPFTLHSVTPPRHVMAELAAEVQGRLRM